ncbi:MAG: hypothetical protein PHP17_06740, partial [Candidatus Omnitrophica bacterium]|nr:hypothetical protein [Candidatus Omnitrophota bacterium]
FVAATAIREDKSIHIKLKAQHEQLKAKDAAVVSLKKGIYIDAALYFWLMRVRPSLVEAVFSHEASHILDGVENAQEAQKICGSILALWNDSLYASEKRLAILDIFLTECNVFVWRMKRLKKIIEGYAYPLFSRLDEIAEDSTESFDPVGAYTSTLDGRNAGCVNELLAQISDCIDIYDFAVNFLQKYMNIMDGIYPRGRFISFREKEKIFSLWYFAISQFNNVLKHAGHVSQTLERLVNEADRLGAVTPVFMGEALTQQQRLITIAKIAVAIEPQMLARLDRWGIRGFSSQPPEFIQPYADQQSKQHTQAASTFILMWPFEAFLSFVRFQMSMFMSPWLWCFQFWGNTLEAKPQTGEGDADKGEN